jgi:hypothetical protein
VSTDYTLVFDAGQQDLPLLPLAALALLLLLVLLLLAATRTRRGYVPQGWKLTLWGVYMFHVVAVFYGYGALWHQRDLARDPTGAVTEIGRIAEPQGRGNTSGIFLDAVQRFSVNDQAVVYRNRSLRALGFLYPHFDPVPLPLINKAHVRVTYRGQGDERELVRFEIAATDLQP